MEPMGVMTLSVSNPNSCHIILRKCAKNREQLWESTGFLDDLIGSLADLMGCWLKLEPTHLFDVIFHREIRKSHQIIYDSWIDIPKLQQPIPSMYGIFAYIWLIFTVYVGKYTIHGWYRVHVRRLKTLFLNFPYEDQSYRALRWFNRSSTMASVAWQGMSGCQVDFFPTTSPSFTNILNLWLLKVGWVLKSKPLIYETLEIHIFGIWLKDSHLTQMKFLGIAPLKGIVS